MLKKLSATLILIALMCSLSYAITFHIDDPVKCWVTSNGENIKSVGHYMDCWCEASQYDEPSCGTEGPDRR